MPSDITEAIRKEVRDKAHDFLRALIVLSMYQDVPPDLLDHAKVCIPGLLEKLGIDATGKASSYISYGGLKCREAVSFELSWYGEGRTIGEVEAAVFSRGFEKEREGQVRSSINAKANRGVYFDVRAGEKVYLLNPAEQIAEKLKKRFGLS